MTQVPVPDVPAVLNTTVHSNFAYIERVDLLTGLTNVYTVPVVRDELQAGFETHPYLQTALDAPNVSLLVVTMSEAVANREAIVRAHLDPGEAQAFAGADAHGGRLLTDDGDARSFAKAQGGRVTRSAGILLAAIDVDQIASATADEWLTQ